ncbi:hypothetical protein HK100_002810, partial [Physocladia obscura]
DLNLRSDKDSSLNEDLPSSDLEKSTRPFAADYEPFYFLALARLPLGSVPKGLTGCFHRTIYPGMTTLNFSTSVTLSKVSDDTNEGTISDLKASTDSFIGDNLDDSSFSDPSDLDSFDTVSEEE